MQSRYEISKIRRSQSGSFAINQSYTGHESKSILKRAGSYQSLHLSVLKEKDSNNREPLPTFY